MEKTGSFGIYKKAAEALRENRGSMLVFEATIVFPIMLFIVAIMILLGNAFYQEARVERLIAETAIEAAARGEDPMLSWVEENGSVPEGTSEVTLRPYRYVIPGEANRTANGLQEELMKKIESLGAGAFGGMQPRVSTCVVRPKMYILFSYMEVECSFRAEFPIKLIFSREKLGINYKMKLTEPITDAADFVRTVSFAGDLLERSEGVTNFTGKIKASLDSIMQIFN